MASQCEILENTQLKNTLSWERDQVRFQSLQESGSKNAASTLCLANEQQFVDISVVVERLVSVHVEN